MSLLGHLKPRLEIPEQLFWLEDDKGPLALAFKDEDGFEGRSTEMDYMAILVNAIYKHHYRPDPDDPQGYRELYQQVLWYITDMKICDQHDNLEQIVLFGMDYIIDIHDEISRKALTHIRKQEET